MVKEKKQNSDFCFFETPYTSPLQIEKVSKHDGKKILYMYWQTSWTFTQILIKTHFTHYDKYPDHLTYFTYDINSEHPIHFPEDDNPNIFYF